MYQFFQYKEELRTAKISLLVLVIAVLCWGPFFLNLALLASLFRTKNVDGDEDEDQGEEGGYIGAKDTIIHWTHYLSNLLMLCFAAISPFVYVFRSAKVQKCLGKYSNIKVLTSICKSTSHK